MQSRPWYFCGLAGRSPARAARCQRAWRRCRAHQWFAPLVGRQQNGIQRINWLSRAQGTSHTVSFLPQLASRGANEGGLIDQLVHHSLPQFKNDLQNEHKYVAVMPSSGPDDALTPIDQAILGGEQKYTAPIRVPILAIFAVPHKLSDLFNDNPKAEAAAEAVDMEQTSAQIRAFERGHPSARVLRLADANHYVFKSNQADVLSAINTFIGEDSWPKSRSTTTF